MIPSECILDAKAKLIHPKIDCKRIGKKDIHMLPRNEAIGLLNGDAKVCKVCLADLEEVFNWLKARSG